jgi:hypothetical protein
MIPTMDKLTFSDLLTVLENIAAGEREELNKNDSSPEILKRYHDETIQIRNEITKRAEHKATKIPFVVNLDVLVFAESEEAAKDEAMRISPMLHSHEHLTSLTKVCYVNAQLYCPNCHGFNVGEYNTGKRFRCDRCGNSWD